MKRIGIIGARVRDTEEDYILVRNKFLEIYEPGDTIVSGGCPRGGDMFAKLLMVEFDTPEIIHYPDKSKINHNLPRNVAYARICYARNTLIANDSDVLIACVAPDRKGGTEDTIKKFLLNHKEEDLYLV